jgi:molybdenum cofactor cytidylyltransferase
VSVLAHSGAAPVIVVTGGAHESVEAALRDMPAQPVFNPRHADGEMLHSLQVGLASLPAPIEAALVALGDQPQIEAPIVQAVLHAYFESSAPLVVPSFQMRRGHPWLVHRSLWGQILEAQEASTLRDFLNRNAEQIHYLAVESDSILRDVDTPEEYEKEREKPGFLR